LRSGGVALFSSPSIGKIIPCIIIPTQAPIDDLLLDIVDNAWRMEVLPFDQILVPREKLPDPEADGGDSHLTVSEQVS